MLLDLLPQDNPHQAELTCKLLEAVHCLGNMIVVLIFHELKRKSLASFEVRGLIIKISWMHFKYVPNFQPWK